MAIQAHPGTHFNARVALEALLIGMVGVVLVGLIVIAGTRTSSPTALIHRPAAEEKALADFRLSEKGLSLAEIRSAESQFRLTEKTDALTPAQVQQAELRALAQFRLSEK